MLSLKIHVLKKLDKVRSKSVLEYEHTFNKTSKSKVYLKKKLIQLLWTFSPGPPPAYKGFTPCTPLGDFVSSSTPLLWDNP